jgi:hypothetical protein
MSLSKGKRIIAAISSNPNIKAISIKTTRENFEKKMEGSPSLFFKKLKNGLNSINGMTNREYFRNLSGCYFSLEDTNNLEIIILYDSGISKLTELQVHVRIKKLLGLDIEIKHGTYAEFENRISEMLGIVSRTQTFGDFYLNKSIDEVEH